MDPYYQEIREWFAARGDATYITNHPLTESSIVFDIGAYTGVWAEKIKNIVDCKLYLIEPIHEFYKEIQQRFAGISNVKYKQVGIGLKEDTLDICVANNGDATKIVNANHANNENHANTVAIQMESMEKIMKDWDIQEIDLLQINIEGAEYDVLDKWIETGTIQKIKTIQIQFHNFAEIDNYVGRRENIRRHLKELGFREKYNFQWVWECWTQL